MTTIPAAQKKDGQLVLHLLGMYPLPVTAKRPSTMFLPWFTAGLFDEQLRGLQKPVAAIAFHAPACTSRFWTVTNEPVTQGAKRLALSKGQEVIIPCLKNIARSPFDPPAYGNLYPALDYAGLDRRRLLEASVLQEAMAEQGEGVSQPVSIQSEDLSELDPHQLARALGVECVSLPYDSAPAKILSFACLSVPVRSGLTQKGGKIAAPAETTPVLERFIWPDGEGGVESRTLTLFDLAHHQERCFTVGIELDRLRRSGYTFVAADLESGERGSVRRFAISLPSAVLCNERYHHPAEILAPCDPGGMIRLLGGREETPGEPPGIEALLGLAKGLLTGWQNGREFSSLYRAQEDRLGKLCHNVLRLGELAQERLHAAAATVPNRVYSTHEMIQWAAYEPKAVDEAVARLRPKDDIPARSFFVFSERGVPVKSAPKPTGSLARLVKFAPTTI